MDTQYKKGFGSKFEIFLAPYFSEPGEPQPWAAIVRLTPDGQVQCTHALYLPARADELVAGARSRLVFYNAWEGDVIITCIDPRYEIVWHVLRAGELIPIEGRAAACKIWGRWPAAKQFGAENGAALRAGEKKK